MFELSSAFYVCGSNYASRRSGSGAVSVPAYLGTAHSMYDRTSYNPRSALPVAEVARRVYGAVKPPEQKAPPASSMPSSSQAAPQITRQKKVAAVPRRIPARVKRSR